MYTAAEVAGQWIGFSASNPAFCRLDLGDGKTGFLVGAFAGATSQGAIRFEISKWDLASNVLTGTFLAPDMNDSLNSEWPVTMRCDVRQDRLEATLLNSESGWRRSIIFCREKEFDQTLRVLRMPQEGDRALHPWSVGMRREELRAMLADSWLLVCAPRPKGGWSSDDCRPAGGPARAFESSHEGNSVQTCEVYLLGSTHAPSSYYGHWLNFFYFDSDERLIGFERRIFD
jgi:hypothetical protein